MDLCECSSVAVECGVWAVPLHHSAGGACAQVVLYVPEPNQFGDPFDSFSVAMRLDGVELSPEKRLVEGTFNQS